MFVQRVSKYQPRSVNKPKRLEANISRHITYLLSREVQRERELPEPWSSFPLSPAAHFSGFLVQAECSGKSLVAGGKTALGNTRQVSTRFHWHTSSIEFCFLWHRPSLFISHFTIHLCGSLMVNVCLRAKPKIDTKTPPNSVRCTALLTCTSNVCHSAHEDPRDLILASDWPRCRANRGLWLVDTGGQVTGLRAMPGTLVQGGMSHWRTLASLCHLIIMPPSLHRSRKI